MKRWLDAEAKPPEAKRLQELLAAEDVAPAPGAEARVWRRLAEDRPAARPSPWWAMLLIPGAAAAIAAMSAVVHVALPAKAPVIEPTPAPRRAVEVRAGEHAPVAPAQLVETAPAQLAETAPAQLAETAPAPVVVAPAPLVQPAARDVPSRTAAAERPRRVARQSAPPLEAAPTLEPNEGASPTLDRAPTAEPSREGRAPIGEATPDIVRAPHVAEPAPSPRAATPPAAPAWDEEATYRRARSAANPALALELFDEVVSRGGALAEISALQAAELEVRRGRWSSALTRFDALLAAFPGGVLAPEARLGAIECELKSDRPREAKSRLDVALKVDSDSPDLRYLRAELSRRDDRCEDAIADYRAASRSRSADDAGYYLAWCLLETSPRDGELALSSYLTRFPNGRHAAEARAHQKRLESSPKKD